MKSPGQINALSTVFRGRSFEAQAKAFLKQQGLKAFHMNFTSRCGEIDIIARDGETLVFVEVRYRKNQDHGSAVATVDFHKQQKIIRTAQHFLQKNGLTNKMPCRFDVVGITGSGNSLEFQWIKNAF